MNLIDCEEMVIVAATESSQWLALSYVWGVDMPAAVTVDGETRFRAGSRMSTNLPATIRDAMVVTRQLGHRYLWVDEYCIDQGSESHRDAQISKMNLIYQGATLTIVAAAGNDKEYGLPGVGSKRKKRPLVRINDTVIFSNELDPEYETPESK